MSLHVWSTLSIPDFLVIMHVGLLVISMFNGSFSAECTVRSLIRRVAEIPDTATINAVSFYDRMIAKISEMKKVLPVPPVNSENTIYHFCL